MANEVIIKDFETILGEINSDLASFNSPITNTQEGGGYDLIKRICSLIISDFYVTLEKAIPLGFATTTAGSFMDLKAQEVSLLRKEPGNAQKVFILRRVNTVGVLQIVTGDVIKSPTIPDVGKLRWITVQAEGSILPAGIAAEFLDTVGQIEVTFEADDAGSDHNNMEEKLNVGQVTMEIESGLAGVDGVPPVESKDSVEIIPGTDLESDANLLIRILGQWTKLAAGSTESSYINFALESSPTVESASALASGGSGAPTQVTVTVAGGPGSRVLPVGINVEQINNFAPNYTDDGLITGTVTPLGNEIHAFIRERIPVTDILILKSVTEVFTTLGVSVLAADGFDKTDLKALVQKRIFALFIPQAGVDDVQVLNVAEPILNSRLTKILNNTDGVEDFTITDPAAGGDKILPAPANEKVFNVTGIGDITVVDL